MTVRLSFSDECRRGVVRQLCWWEGPSSMHLCVWGLVWARTLVRGELADLRASLPLSSGPGNLGSQLVEYKEEMYITSDCGHTWRQVRWEVYLFCPPSPPRGLLSGFLHLPGLMAGHAVPFRQCDITIRGWPHLSAFPVATARGDRPHTHRHMPTLVTMTIKAKGKNASNRGGSQRPGSGGHRRPWGSWQGLRLRRRQRQIRRV